MNCVLYGNLTRDPDTLTTSGGTTLAKFSVAENWQYKDKEGVSFFECVAFGKTASTISMYLKKGQPILIFGDMRQETWADSANQKKSRFVITINNFKFIGSRSDKTGQSHEPPASDEDVIPF